MVDAKMRELGARETWATTIPSDEAYYSDPVNIYGYMRNCTIVIVCLYSRSGGWDVHGQITKDGTTDGTLASLAKFFEEHP